MFARHFRDLVAVAFGLLLAIASFQQVAGQQVEQSQQTGSVDGNPAVLTRDDFDGKLNLQWDIRQPDSSRVSLTKRPGFFTITTQRGDLFEAHNSAKNVYLTRAPRPFKDIQIQRNNLIIQKWILDTSLIIMVNYLL